MFSWELLELYVGFLMFAVDRSSHRRCSGTGVFLWVLRNFYMNTYFHRTPPVAASKHIQALSCSSHVLKFWPKSWLDVVNKKYADIWEQKRSDRVQFVEDSLEKTWSDMVWLGRSYHLRCFKSCLPQILLGLFLNTLSHILIDLFYWYIYCDM